MSDLLAILQATGKATPHNLCRVLRIFRLHGTCRVAVSDHQIEAHADGIAYLF